MELWADASANLHLANVLFVSFTEAIDKALHDLLLFNLNTFGLPDAFLLRITDVTEGRTFYVRVAESHSSLQVAIIGVPQSFVLRLPLVLVHANHFLSPFQSPCLMCASGVKLAHSRIRGR